MIIELFQYIYIVFRDNVVWDEEQEESAKKITEKQLEKLAEPEKIGKYFCYSLEVLAKRIL